MLTEFAGRVAAITGAASGFGREFARIAAARGMRLGLADIDATALRQVADEMRAAGAEVVTERVDVSIGDDVGRFARSTRDAFGQVDLLFNNAGVATTGYVWESTERDWQWVLGVNLWGVIHGVRHFVPAMIEQRTAGHVVNTASVAGLLSPPAMGAYNVSKHGVVALTETLFHDFKLAGAALGCSVLCPAFVATGIADSGRNRPAALRDATPETAAQGKARKALEKAITSGRLSAADIGRTTFEAIEQDRFYIVTHDRIRGSIALRHADIDELRQPSDPYADKPDAAARLR